MNREVFFTASFQIQKFRSDGLITYQGPVFKNTVLTCGLDALAQYKFSQLISTINVGEGHTLPTTDDTELEMFVGATSNMSSAWNFSYYYQEPARLEGLGIFEFPVGAIVGDISEVALSNSAHSNLFNRQLIRDVTGIPTPVGVLETEGLRVGANVFIYLADQLDDPPMSLDFLFEGEAIPASKEINVSNMSAGVLRDYSASPGNFDVWLSTETTGWANPGTKIPTDIAQEYTPGSFTQEFKLNMAAGEYVGEVNSIYVGWSNFPFSVYRLENSIDISNIYVLELQLVRSWGRG